MVKKSIVAEEIKIEIGEDAIKAFLHLPEDAKGIVLFAHGSGSGRLSPRNQLVASFLQESNIATLLLDLLTEDEEREDLKTRALRFNIPFLAKRLLDATHFITKYPTTHHLNVGYFGASTGAAAALVAAAESPHEIKAVVSRGGRPDLAGNELSLVKAPTLLIVGGNDFGVIEINQQAYALLTCPKKLEIVEGATHLFEEKGTLEHVSVLAARWFSNYL